MGRHRPKTRRLLGALDLVVVHRTDNDPPVRDAKTITAIANSGVPVSLARADFGHLLKLIIDASGP
jgi:hypothetical protein